MEASPLAGRHAPIFMRRSCAGIEIRIAFLCADA